MELTKNTTEEELVAPVQKARDRVALLAADTSPTADLEALLGAVHNVWEQAALAKVRYEIVGCLQHYGEVATIERDRALQKLFIDILSRGADDSWSGRKNDARRAAFDAVRKEIQDLRWTLVRS